MDEVKPGSDVIIRNAKVLVFSGFMRLTVDMWGLIEENPEPLAIEVNESKNVSLDEYELAE